MASKTTAARKTPASASKTTAAPSSAAPQLRILGASIRDARQTLGISTRKMAELLAMDRSNYLRIEGGRTNVTYETLLRIAVGLGMDLVVELRSKPPRSTVRRRPSSKKA